MPKRKRPSSQPASSDDIEVDRYVPGQTLPPKWSPDAYARWFFDFLRIDLATLTPGQLLGMRADLWAFVRPEIVLNTSWGDEHLPPAETLEAFQRDARAGIQRVREGQWFTLEQGIGYGIARLGNQVVKGRRSGTFEDLFRAAVMDTVQAFWDRLYECPRCHAIFLKVGKQKYCSSTCASRAHWDAFKARRRARDHHLEYARRTQKRLGANAKVRIKPRRAK
ncbi:MAG: hypothetical protein HYU37_09420 [Acidobacteria bacterium]|nr:hypothetical protein [Acidobacteriota bacterium]